MHFLQKLLKKDKKGIKKKPSDIWMNVHNVVLAIYVLQYQMELLL